VTEPLYRKLKNNRYQEIKPEEEEVTTLTFTDGQCITAAASLGVTLLMIFERNIPPHKRIARKISNVRESILDLFAGTGEPLHPDIAEKICKCWDKTMRSLEEGI
jgi:hypothetical protein